MPTASRIVLLGPQRREPFVIEVLRSLQGVDPKAPVAIVTAGWEEREGEIQEFEQHIGVRAINLSVFQRIEEIYKRDPALHTAVQRRHDRQRALQEIYRLRLAHALGAARELFARHGDAWLLVPERDAAIESLRALDAHHLERVRLVQAEFDADHPLAEHPLVARHRAELQRIARECSVLCIAGGHVAILLNRLRTIGLLSLWHGGPIVAWSAGAMALAERIVLFHDNPPQGAGKAEVLEPGLGLARGVLPLPHASARLRLDDAEGVRLMARRFAPYRCMALDPRCRIDWDGVAWRGLTPTQQLEETGMLAELPA